MCLGNIKKFEWKYLSPAEQASPDLEEFGSPYRDDTGYTLVVNFISQGVSALWCLAIMVSIVVNSPAASSHWPWSPHWLYCLLLPLALLCRSTFLMLLLFHLDLVDFCLFLVVFFDKYLLSTAVIVLCYYSSGCLEVQDQRTSQGLASTFTWLLECSAFWREGTAPHLGE